MKRKRRQRRRRIVTAAAAAVVVAAAGSTILYWNLPGTRADRKLNRAMDLMTEMDYVQAEEVYTQALSIDENSVRAYRGLADDYLAQGRDKEALDILKKGYEVTGSEVLLQNYSATVLNRVVERVNEGSADLSDIESCLDVLEADPSRKEAVSLLETCAGRVLGDGEKSLVLLERSEGDDSFDRYCGILERLFSLTEQDLGTFLPVLEQYAVIQAPAVYLSLSNADEYREILNRAQQLGVEEAAGILACLDKQEEVSAYFAPMFEDFEAQNFEAAKDFITDDAYVQIRDAFISDTMEYWYGGTYIPVTKEAIVFLQTEKGWMFSFVEDDSLAAPTGTIRVLGQKMEDLGVQRSSIEYVPSYDPQQYYPHTEYEIVYWNTMVSGIATDNTNVVSRMNYRFAEKIYTAQGMEANMIYDWGGANETRKKE